MAVQNRMATRAHPIPSPPTWRAGPALPLQAHEPGDPQGYQAGEEAGEQGGVVEDAHADHLHAEYSGGHRSAEQGGEQGAHAAQDDEVHVPLVQPQPLAQRGRQGTADLKGRPLPAGAAPGEVGQGRAEKDQQGQPQPGLLPAADAGDDLVGAAVVGHVQSLVAPHDEQPRYRHEEQQPGVCLPRLGDPGENIGKGAARQTAYKAGQSTHYQPAQQGHHGQLTVQELFVPGSLHSSLPPPGGPGQYDPHKL